MPGSGGVLRAVTLSTSHLSMPHVSRCAGAHSADYAKQDQLREGSGRQSRERAHPARACSLISKKPSAGEPENLSRSLRSSCPQRMPVDDLRGAGGAFAAAPALVADAGNTMLPVGTSSRTCARKAPDGQLEPAASSSCETTRRQSRRHRCMSTAVASGGSAPAACGASRRTRF